MYLQPSGPTATVQVATVAVASSSDSKQNLPDQKGKTSNSDKKENKSRKQYESSCSSPAKRTKCPGLVGDPIDGSENGKTCHQCRQKTMGFVAACKNQKKHKACTIKYCDRCIMNRYGEKAEDVAVLEDWNCPKCRGICNCSFCMKKRGHQPTGILVLAARANGFSSVSELLHAKGIENFGIDKTVKGMNIGPTKAAASKNKPTVSLPKNNYADIPLPQGTELTTVAGIDLSVKDVGHALQFLEFCAAFKEILDLKEGEPEYVLHELIRGGSGCQGKYSPVVRFHIQLLSLIRKDLGENFPVINPKHGKNSWLQALHNCVSRAQCVLTKLKLEKLGSEADDYDCLGSSEKLRLLNFLCDEFLSTAKTRSWIKDQNSKFVERVKEVKERIFSAKLKEKQLKQKMQDQVAEAVIAKNGASLSVSEHEAIVAQIKVEATQAHAEMLASKAMLPMEKCISEAVRTEPVLFDNKGRAFWRLNGYSDESKVLLQDVGTRNAIGSDEKWFTYDVEQEKEIEKYICSSRKRREKVSQSTVDRPDSD